MAASASFQLTPPPSTSGRYKVYNYFKQSEGTVDCQNVESWKELISELTRDKMIVSWSHYTTPLKALGGLGGMMRSMSLALNRANGSHGLFHKFLVFDLRSVKDVGANLSSSATSSCAVSIEKLRDGLLFQLSKSNVTVKDKVEGSTRKKAKLHASSSKGGFEGALVNNLATIQKILDVVETSALYELLSSNCQDTVNDWQRVLVDKSLSLKFHAPGCDEPLALNDDKVIDVVNDLYPEWNKANTYKSRARFTG